MSNFSIPRPIVVYLNIKDLQVVFEKCFVKIREESVVLSFRRHKEDKLEKTKLTF
jgi:hypothetical protein